MTTPKIESWFPLDFFSALKHTYCRHHFRSTLEPPVSDQPKCKDWVVAYERWSFTILRDPGADGGGEGKSKRAEKYGTKKSKERREEPFFTFLRAIVFRPFRLSLAPTICP